MLRSIHHTWTPIGPALLAAALLAGCERTTGSGANAPGPAAPAAPSRPTPTAIPEPASPADEPQGPPTEAQHLPSIDLRVKDRWLHAEVARTERQRETGLMFRRDLDDDAGMLFVFPSDDFRNFWMHDTPLPLSIAYVAADGRITQISDMQSYDESVVPSREQVRFALEVHQGWFRAAGVREGDRVSGLDRAGAGGR